MNDAWITRAVAAGAVALMLTMTGCQDDEPSASGDATTTPAPAQELASRPDLTPPLIDVSTEETADAAPSDDELTFLAPKPSQDEEAPMTGGLIVDAEGEPVWVNPTKGKTYDLRVQEYQGEPVLTYWRGEQRGIGYGAGEFVILDRSYKEVATVTTAGTERADFHEMTLTDEGTALLISYPIVEQDLTELDGPSDGYVISGIVQEVDVATGEVLFEWDALDHIPVTETMNDMEDREGQSGTKEEPFDYIHINSVTEDGDAVLISARSTHAVYRVDRTTGELDWTLGGSASDFEMTEDSYFAWQHDAQRQPDGTITLFDNQSSPKMSDNSRGLRLELDEEERTASVVSELLPPEERLSDSQGNMQVKENGNVVIGWGSEPYYSEYSEDGELLMDARLSGGHTYRAYKFPWVGEPTEPPTAVVDDGTAHVSWNGATEVASWRFLAGADAASATEVTTVERDGFETSADVPDQPYVAVEALDDEGRVLAKAKAKVKAAP